MVLPMRTEGYFVAMEAGVVPLQSLIGELSPVGGTWAAGIVIGFSILTAAAWKRGIRRYESASS